VSYDKEAHCCLQLRIQDNPVTPHIKTIGTLYSLTVDGQTIFTSLKSFNLALQCWFAAFWIFQVEYPHGLQKCCEFVEKVLLGGKGKASAGVARWANRLL
jgi:hypothetical protein